MTFVVRGEVAAQAIAWKWLCRGYIVTVVETLHRHWHVNVMRRSER